MVRPEQPSSDPPSLLRNINANRWPLLIIATFVGVFVSFLTRGTKADNDQVAREALEITVGFHKLGKVPKTYFAELADAVKDAFSRNRQEFTLKEFEYINDEDELYRQLAQGKVDICGELSPLQYVANYNRCKFSPLVSIEYDNKAFYRAVLFVPLEATIKGNTFVSTPGVNNLRTIKDLVLKQKQKIAHLQSKISTSGYYYPRSYLLDHEIDFGHTSALMTDDQIFLEVLSKNDNGIVAGWLADFRLQQRMVKADEAKAIPARERTEEEANFAACADPWIVDRSDPIPNGVFVVSDAFRKRCDKERLETLIGIWKTIRLGAEGPGSITGWRTGVESDLNIVERHRDKVTYHGILLREYEKVVAMAIGFLVLLVAGVTLFVLKQIGG